MKRWRCTVCGYIHDGPAPPEVCPVCGATSEAFEEIGPEPGGSEAPSAHPVVPSVEAGSDLAGALRSLSYGLFVVSSRSGDRFNAQTCNTVFQVTSEPVQLAVGINRRNLTHAFIEESNVLAVTVLGRGNFQAIRHFGGQSGRNIDKLAAVQYHLSPLTGCPILPSGSYYLEGRVDAARSTDLGTHTLFIVEVLGGGPLRRREPLTYALYQQNRSRPASALDDVEWQHAVTALNLEYAATWRYREQIARLGYPRLVALLEGIMRTEQDHVDGALKYLEGRQTSGNGLSSALLHTRLNLEFERVARDTYARFAAEVDDPGLKSMFAAQARAETGHLRIFEDLLREMEQGSFPISIFCTLCGWSVEFGPNPQVGEEKTCEKCGAGLRLVLVAGNWAVERLSPEGVNHDRG